MFLFIPFKAAHFEIAPKWAGTNIGDIFRGDYEYYVTIMITSDYKICRLLLPLSFTAINMPSENTGRIVYAIKSVWSSFAA